MIDNDLSPDERREIIEYIVSRSESTDMIDESDNISDKLLKKYGNVPTKLIYVENKEERFDSDYFELLNNAKCYRSVFFNYLNLSYKFLNILHAVALIVMVVTIFFAIGLKVSLDSNELLIRNGILYFSIIAVSLFIYQLYLNFYRILSFTAQGGDVIDIINNDWEITEDNLESHLGSRYKYLEAKNASVAYKICFYYYKKYNAKKVYSLLDLIVFFNVFTFLYFNSSYDISSDYITNSNISILEKLYSFRRDSSYFKYYLGFFYLKNNNLKSAAKIFLEINEYEYHYYPAQIYVNYIDFLNNSKIEDES